MNEEFSLEDALIILRRRIWYFLVPFLVIAPLGVIAIMAMPAVYKAEGTILVESQQIPDDFVRSTINAYAQERIQTIRQRVMTLNKLNEVAQKHGVFPASSRLSDAERADQMRGRLEVDLITVERSGRAGDGTIAFTVAFDDRDPERAHLVANEIMTLFLAEDVRTRKAGASSTTDFFEQESARLRTQVADVENRISQFKAENADALPEHLNMHLDSLERANREFLAVQRVDEQLGEEKQFLATQLMTGAAGGDGLSAQLAALESQLARLRATYRDDYPEVRATRDEIAAIKRQMAPSPAIERAQNDLENAEQALTTLIRAEDADPDAVIAAEEAVEQARQTLSDRISAEARSGGTDPSSAQIESRIAVIDSRVRSNERRKAALEDEIDDLKARIARTPAVERELSAFLRDYENLDREYRDIRSKQQEAQLAENLEANQQGEKFSIVEPAARPDQPSSPDRPKLIVLALFAALAAGSAAAVLAELLISTVRGRGHLSAVMGEHPIAVVPYIQGEGADRSVFRRFRKQRPAAAEPVPEAA